MFSGRAFHRAGAAQEKARSPADTNLEWGILRRKRSDDRRLRLWQTGWSMSEMYTGIVPWRARYTITRTLNWSLRWIGSQWSSFRTGVMWSYFLVPMIRRAAQFCTCCSLLIEAFGTPRRRLLLESRREVTSAWTRACVAFLRGKVWNGEYLWEDWNRS